jgi:hypothetical protein
MFLRAVKQMAKKQGVTEQLEVENQMAWVSKMENIQAVTRKVVRQKIVFK